MRAYLAGPDVFFPDPEVWLDRKKTICVRYGITGVSPLDPIANQPADWDALPFWRMIAHRNEAHIRGCDIIIANLTPFRGPSADVGTVFEVGFARALGMKILGYATTTMPFLARTRAAYETTEQPDGSYRDQDGLLVEQFGLFDNLMIEGGIAGSGGILITGDAGRWTDLTLFERCVQTAAASQSGF